jgi:hypothetical protein
LNRRAPANRDGRHKPGHPDGELSLLDESGATTLSCFAGEGYPHQSPNG